MEEVQLETKTYCCEFINWLEELLAQATRLSMGIACWRKPHSTQIFVLIDKQGGQFLDELTLETQEKGFVFQAFSTAKKPFYLKGNLVLNSEEDLDVNKKKWNKFASENKSAYAKDRLSYRKKNTFKSSLAQSESIYISAVDKAKEEISKGVFDKVVLAKKKIEPYSSSETSEAKFFSDLCKAYPSAFISLVMSSETGVWIGASPEVLITIDQNKLFKTVALAGTQQNPENLPLHQISWTQKEIEEQALVSRYIINCFKKIRLREFEEKGPKTVHTGNLFHLKTEFEVNMNEVSFPDLGTQMLKLLHPTSAVCGMPKEISEEFIIANENFDREYFAGFLGSVQIDDTVNLYVNLRCMQWLEDGIACYAGAGITSDSDSKKEWLETEAKCATLLNVLNSI